jgi:hypothetical protein
MYLSHTFSPSEHPIVRHRVHTAPQSSGAGPSGVGPTIGPFFSIVHEQIIKQAKQPTSLRVLPIVHTPQSIQQIHNRAIDRSTN